MFEVTKPTATEDKREEQQPHHQPGIKENNQITFPLQLCHWSVFSRDPYLLNSFCEILSSCFDLIVKIGWYKTYLHVRFIFPKQMMENYMQEYSWKSDIMIFVLWQVPWTICVIEIDLSFSGSQTD